LVRLKNDFAWAPLEDFAAKKGGRITSPTALPLSAEKLKNQRERGG